MSRKTSSKTESKKNKNTPLAENLTVHAWNGSLTKVAVSPNNNEVWIMNTDGKMDPSRWTREHILSEHMGFVSGIDWHGETNTIVTCGHDRNAYVWTLQDDGKWHHELVILRISRSATSVKWCPDGKKFAVTSGAKVVPICSYVQKQEWWAGKHIKKGFKSTVVAVDWCINNKFIVSGATDFKCRIHSAWTKGIDAPEDDGFGELWPEQHNFGEMLAQFDQAQAWVNSVAWSPDGFRVVFAGHGSTMHFVSLNDNNVTTLRTADTPYLDLAFLDNDTVVAGGFGLNPTIFRAEGEEWTLAGLVDEEKKKEKKSAGSATSQARKMFGNMSSRGETKKTSGGLAYKTLHQNTITCIRHLGGARFSTTGIDGRFLFWDLTTSGVSDLKAIGDSIQ
jgi:actin related protein 2/3 complex subunit 1A/1B